MKLLPSFFLLNELRRTMAYLDSFPLSRVLRDRQARLAPHKGAILQSATGEEL